MLRSDPNGDDPNREGWFLKNDKEKRINDNSNEYS